MNNIKDKLDSLKDKKRLLKVLERQLAQAKEDVNKIKSTSYGDRVKGGSIISEEEKYILHLEKIQKRIDNVMNEIFEIEDYISDRIVFLSEIEQAMIIDRYIHGYSWRKICREYHYSERQPYRIINSALNKIEKMS